MICDNSFKLPFKARPHSSRRISFRHIVQKCSAMLMDLAAFLNNLTKILAAQSKRRNYAVLH